MSGAVANVHYIDEFLTLYLPAGYALKLKEVFGGPHRGPTRLYELKGPGFAIPVRG